MLTCINSLEPSDILVSNLQKGNWESEGLSHSTEVTQFAGKEARTWTRAYGFPVHAQGHSLLPLEWDVPGVRISLRRENININQRDLWWKIHPQMKVFKNLFQIRQFTLASCSLPSQFALNLPRHPYHLGQDYPLEKERIIHSSILVPMDRGAWRATVHGITKSDTTKWLSMQEAKVGKIPANVAGRRFLLRNFQGFLLPLSHPLCSQRMDYSGSKMPNEDIIRVRRKTRGEESRETESKGWRDSME